MEYISHCESETEAVGESLAKRLSGGETVALCGEMGAGKTVFVRGVARGLGCDMRVTSPTYTIVNEYPTNPPLFHFDLYRLSSADELFEIGFDDYLSRGGICFIEWFENCEGEYEPDITVKISRGDGEEDRIIKITEGGR